MGQSSSTPLGSRADGKGSGPPPRPNSPPSRPLTPKTPTYVVPGNKVLPDGLGDVGNIRKLLRPVSQELSKFHPEYVDMFQYDTDLGLDTTGDDSSLERSLSINKENSILKTNPSSTSKQISNGLERAKPVGIHSGPAPVATNGSVPKTNITKIGLKNGHIPNGSSSGLLITSPGVVSQGSDLGSRLRRTHSLEKEKTPGAKVTRHRRQSSVTATCPLQDTVIFEDPREHLYNVARHEPFSNMQPNTTSLPLESTFNLDYSFNVTYAQLAEYRRQKRHMELEERTGKKLEALGAEISASSTVPKSPFDRQNLGGKTKPSGHSVSTGSSDTGVSKSKKKKAPAPPAPPPPTTTTATTMIGSTKKESRNQSPGRISMTTEPPADYDMEDVSAATRRHSRSLQRNPSSASIGSESPTQKPRTRQENVPQNTEKNAMSAASVTLQPPPPPAPPLPTMMSSTRNVRSSSITVSPQSLSRPLGSVGSTSVLIEQSKPLQEQTGLQQSMSDAKAQLEALKKLEDILKNPRLLASEISDSVKQANIVCSTDAISDKSIQSDKIEVTSGNIPTDINETEQTRNYTLVPTQDGGTERESADEIVKESFTIPTNTPEPQFESYNGALASLDSSSTSDHSGRTPTKKMSSLLQHDIVLAAQARGSKPVKVKPPTALERPRDAAEMFREELAKAASAREERRKSALIDECLTQAISNNTPQDDGKIVYQSSDLKASRRDINDTSSNDKKLEVERRKDEGKSSLPLGSLDSDMGLRSSQSESVPAVVDSDHGVKDIVAGVGFDQRQAVLAEDMSTTSSSGSHRVFKSHWTPEDDLGSDDDIMDDVHVHHERTVSSEGFKSSIIPGKIGGLKDGKKVKKKKEKQRQKEQKLIPGSEFDSSIDDKTKFEGIRKFRKSVHEGVKNAFGSISKASGKLLKRPKSQEFLDIRNAPVVPGSPPEEELLEYLRNPNWELSDSRNGSLVRTVSDGCVTLPYNNGVETSESSEDSDDSEEAGVDDIDFAGGIDDIPSPREGRSADGRVEAGEGQRVKQMKRAGVAYVSKKGQIIVLPEYETVALDGKGHVLPKNGDQEENGGRAPRIFRKKKQKFTFDSTLKKQERNRLDDSVSMEIQEKERQIEIERVRQQDMERDFRRLRDLEAQERLQRIQTATMREQITMLQQQQVRQAHFDLTNGAREQGAVDPFTGLPTAVSPRTTFVNPKTLAGSTYFPRNDTFGGPVSLQSSSQMGSSTSSLTPQLYTLPTPLPTVLGHPISHTSIQTPLDPSSHIGHTAPIVGSGPSIGNTSGRTNTLPSLTPQELSYLSEYMRRMGVTPPSTQHQWAVLLSTISLNAPAFPNLSPGYTSPAPNGFTLMGNGPDLSHILGSGKTVASTTGESKKQIISVISNSHTTPGVRDPGSVYRLPEESIYYKAMLQNLMDTTTSDSPQHFHTQQQQLPSTKSKTTALNHNLPPSPESSLNTSYGAPSSESVTGNDSNLIPQTSSVVSAEDHRPKQLDIQNSLKENQKYITSTQVVVDGNQMLPRDETVDTQKEIHSPRLPAKVYGPLGFRPVTFLAGSS